MWELYSYVVTVSSSKPLPALVSVADMESPGVLEDKMDVELPVKSLKREDGVPWEAGRTRQVVVPGRVQRRTYTSYV